MPRRRNNPWNRPEKETHTPYHNPNKGGGRGGETRGGGKSRGGGRGGEAVSNDTADSISDVLSLLMEKYSRYQNGVLDCSKLDSIEEVQKYNPNLNSAAWCKIIALTVKKLKGCKALTLDSNNVKTLYHLADALSDGVLLDSLSLQYNSIPSMEDIQKLRPLKLRHLLLRGNPLYKTDRDELLKKLKKHLPTLERIDGMEIVRSTVIDSVPLAYAGINENDPPQLTVKDFIGKYFMMSQNCSGPDKGVDQLMDFYDTKATMSFTIQPKLGLAVSGPGLTLVQRFVTSQHNVMLNPNAATVYTGKLNVGKCLESLHQAAITYDSASILRNTEITQVLPEILQSTAMPFPHLFTVVMHGKMTFSFKGKGKEVTSYNKYFDRTWLLTARHNSAIIVNDVLHIRDTKDEQDAVFREAKTKKYYGLHLYADDMKVIQLASETGLSMAAARSCLELDESGPWDLQKAREYFQRKIAEGVLNQSHVVHERDVVKLAAQRFSELTNLVPDMAHKCLTLVNHDLWKGWELFLHKQDSLTREMFQSPPTA